MKKSMVQQRRTRGRPKSIDRDTVLTAAMMLADSDLNLPALAESLGTTVTTIYRLFGDKAGLQAAMYAEALRHIDRIEGADWTLWLKSYARVLLKLTQQYPFVVTLQFSQSNYSSEWRNLAERSLALVGPGIELLVNAGLDRALAHNALVAIKAIVFEHAHTERIYAESMINLAPFETLGSPGEQRLYQLLKIFSAGLRAEMKDSKSR
jgi:AcrR family transcriptional regulator